MSRTPARTLAPFFLLLALAACGDREQAETETAADYASRINGTVPPATSAPGQAQTGPAPAAAANSTIPGVPPVPPGTMTAPEAANCGAPAGETWLGRKYTPDLDREIAGILPAGGAMRVLKHDQSITGIATPSRLNVMLDENGIIRDFLCG